MILNKGVRSTLKDTKLIVEGKLQEEGCQKKGVLGMRSETSGGKIRDEDPQGQKN